MELKPCPFCGGLPEKKVVGTTFRPFVVVKCTRCGAGTKAFKEYQDEIAIEAWNRRAQDV